MEQDFSYLSKVFDDKYEAFFINENNKTIERSFYALGVLLRSTHLTHKKIRQYNPKDHELLDKWDLDIWTRVTWGTDDEKHDIIYEKEADETDLPYYDYLISNATKYNRPSWAIFGLLGMMQGTLNQNQFEVKHQEDFFTKDDFIRNYNYLAIDFLIQNKDDLVYLFNYFDNRGFNLEIAISDNSKSISLIDK